MKQIIFSAIMLLTMNGSLLHAIDQDWKVYAENPKVKSVFAKYQDNTVVQDIINIKDANLRFLALMNEVLLIQGAESECRGFSFLNVGYIDSDGNAVISGSAPETVKDSKLRSKYIVRLKQNKDNVETSNKIFELKNTFLKLMRETIPMMDESHGDIAISVVERLRTLQ